MEDTIDADGLVEIWENVTKIVRYWERLLKTSNFLQKIFLKVQEAVNDKFILPKFHFFSFFGSIFKPFLSKYHIRWPMVLFMYDDLKNLVKSILQFYIKKSFIDSSSNGMLLTKVSKQELENL